MFSQTVDCGVYYRQTERCASFARATLRMSFVSETNSFTRTEPTREYWTIYRGPGFFNLINLMIRQKVHPLPPSLQSVSSTGNTQEDWERETTRKRKRDGKGGGRGAQSSDRKKAWPSINHSIPSVLNTWQTGPRVADTGSSSQW
jgi:hypothetical protein